MKALLAFAGTAIASLFLASVASAAAFDVSAMIETLRARPVYVDPAVRPAITPAEVRELSADIAEHDPGRIVVAVLTPEQANTIGGVTAVANLVDRNLDAPGVVLVVAGENAYIVTAYERSDVALSAANEALNSRGSVFDQLKRAVRALAAVDPGPSADLRSRSPTGAGGGDTGGTGVLLGFVIVLGSIFVLPILVLLIRAAARKRTRRDAALEIETDQLGELRDSLVALGDDIRDLDIDVSMPNADPAGKRAYEQALDRYQRAESLLDAEPTPYKLTQAGEALADGRRLMDAAKAGLAGGHD